MAKRADPLATHRRFELELDRLNRTIAVLEQKEAYARHDLERRRKFFQDIEPHIARLRSRSVQFRLEGNDIAASDLLEKSKNFQKLYFHLNMHDKMMMQALSPVKAKLAELRAKRENLLRNFDNFKGSLLPRKAKL